MTNEVSVKNLPWTTSSIELAEWVKQIAAVVRVEVMVHPVTSRSYGEAVVVLESVNDAIDVVKELSGKTLNGKTVDIAILEKPFRHEVQRPA
jgi:RNA recognition motif-containing protein